MRVNECQISHIDTITKGEIQIEDYWNKGGFPGGSVVKNSPAKQETQVQTLGWEDHLEKEIATHSSILAEEIPSTKEPGRLQPVGSQESGTTQQLSNNNNWKRRKAGSVLNTALQKKRELGLEGTA